MAPSEVRVEVDTGQVRILRDATEARRVGCSTVTVVPMADVVRATSVPGEGGTRYLRLEATRATSHADIDRDPLAVRFDRRQATEADRLAAMIHNNHLVATGLAPPGPRALLAQDDELRRKLNRAATLSVWSAKLTLIMLLVPVVIFVVGVIVILVLVL